MKSPATKRDPASTTSPKAKSRSARSSGGKVLADHIAAAAYFKAQARGFEPGRETQDWLDAEAELLKQTVS